MKTKKWTEKEVAGLVVRSREEIEAMEKQGRSFGCIHDGGFSCTAPVVSKGLCMTHYQRARRRAMGVPAAPEKKGLTSTLTFSLTPALLELISESATAQGIGRAEWVRRAAEAYLTSLEGER